MYRVNEGLIKYNETAHPIVWVMLLSPWERQSLNELLKSWTSVVNLKKTLRKNCLIFKHLNRICYSIIRIHKTSLINMIYNSMKFNQPVDQFTCSVMVKEGNILLNNWREQVMSQLCCYTFSNTGEGMNIDEGEDWLSQIQSTKLCCRYFQLFPITVVGTTWINSQKVGNNIDSWSQYTWYFYIQYCNHKRTLQKDIS